MSQPMREPLGKARGVAERLGVTRLKKWSSSKAALKLRAFVWRLLICLAQCCTAAHTAGLVHSPELLRVVAIVPQSRDWRGLLQNARKNIAEVSFVLVMLVAVVSVVPLYNSKVRNLYFYYKTPINIQLHTYHERYFDTNSTGPSHTSPVRDPRVLSPFEPRSAATAAFFCGRPTGSGYDGFAGAPHAAYVHHDMDHDRFVLRTFGRGGTRVDHRRRTGIGRSTYEAFCGAAPSAQVGTPLAPSPHTAGEANWQLDSAAALAWSGTGAFDFTVRRLATPAALESEAAAAEDFTRADQGIRTHYRRYTRDELLDRHAHMDFIYSYVNGSDITRAFTRPFSRSPECANTLVAVQLLYGLLERDKSPAATAAVLALSEIVFTEPLSPCAFGSLLAGVGDDVDGVMRVEASLWWSLRKKLQRHGVPLSNTTQAPPPFHLTNIELLRALGADLETAKPEDIDADSDELRHSMRGLLQRTRAWHRGRLSIVSPYANVPQWLNQSRNFFLRSLYSDAIVEEKSSGMCHGPLGTAEARYVREEHTKDLHYSRMHVVDQRALMPPAPLTTVNSYAVEPFIYRLHNCSSLYMYMNDDYLVLKDVDVVDVVNEFGGPVLRIRIDDPMIYEAFNRDYFRSGLVYNSMHFHRELDKLPADQDELVQPVLADTLEKLPAEDASLLQRGIVRADWSPFTTVVVTRDAPPGAALRNTPCRETSSTDPVCVWSSCARRNSTANGLCTVPRVSVQGEPEWAVDMAASFELLSQSESQQKWSGQVQTPRIERWGTRVLDRVVADLLAPRYYLNVKKIVAPESEPAPVNTAEAENAMKDRTRALEQIVTELSQRDVVTMDMQPLLNETMNNWIGSVVNHEYTSHRAFQTQPRLRKYRMRLDSHAPYVQCRNMWNYIHTRYATNLNLNMFLMRQRSMMDHMPPSTHTAHLLRHPWAGSSQYIPYLMAKEAWRLQVDGSSVMNPDSGEPPVFPVMDVALDNEDGCAPATYISEAKQSARYHEFRDDLAWNRAAMKTIRGYVNVKPFTNINSKFSQPSIGATLREFFHELFPTPMILEDNWVAQVGKRSFTSDLSIAVTPDARKSKMLSMKHLDAAFQRLTRLPLIVVSNDEEGFCPVLRSLRHAMPAFRGLRVVQVLVPPADGRSLHAARAEQRHAYRNFLPVTRCTLPAGRLVRVALPANSSVADVVVAGLRGAREGLAERHWAAPALVALRGLRAERRAVQAVVVDARTLHGGAAGFTELSLALATPAELLAHEDFAEALLDGDAYAAAQPLVRRPTEEEAAQPASAVYRGEQVPAAKPADYVGSVLVLSHADAASRHVHWAHGASEHDLLSGMPLPHTGLEDMAADVRWLF